MAIEEPQKSAPDAQQADPASKKRKPALDEIEVDLNLPEPPSKKARRALKKGKALPTKPKSDDEDEGHEGESDAADGAPDGNKKKKERSPHGVWIGNLRFSVTKPELRQWLVDNSGGSIPGDAITRVHMPTSKSTRGPGPKTPSENRGFAYVDFATFDANVAAIALSETEWHGRKLLIKDSKSFEGRPKKEPAPVSADGTNGNANANGLPADGKTSAAHGAGGSTKIFVGNMSFNTTKDDLHAHFEKCGKIRWIKVATFEDSGKCKGYGWVNFEDPEAAAWAVKGFVKVRETVETLEDFMDEDEKVSNTADNDGEPEPKVKAEADGSSGSDSDSSDSDDEAKPEKTNSGSKTKPTPVATREPARTRTRKWWVNQLLGRNLKIELAEDDQTRYHKRFGKGAASRRQQQEQNQQDGSRPGGWQGQRPARERGQVGERSGRKEPKPIGHTQTDISVARLTGAAVAPQGKKVTFD
ncbi:uncharacterized protein C8A04DRAFT_8561 [Dichotomopilus funicola]|uniref:RRM domain-containing protein n=1 Tax=Dichotomopilus funicola TaxID=1934379 RepID=A0AAN6ZRZ0_9PEZI|nr:hypothetical protein C8A04DRAFT_8561 [Dichotomopilus funicola]